MRIKICAVLLLMVIFGCAKEAKRKVLLARPLVEGEDFNTRTQLPGNPLSIFSTKADNNETTVFTVKFNDTTLAIQPNEGDKDFVVDKFSKAQFINTQKTTLLVQQADQSGMVSPFYLINLKDNQLQVVNLYRASHGALDREVTQGMVSVGRGGYLINNDFFITNVNSKVYLIKRQQPEERIQGEFFLLSADKQTLVFLMKDGFYQVHYPSGNTLTQPLPSQAPQNKAALYRWVQSNFSWKKDKSGNDFLKANADDNRIVDISEFK